MFGHPPIEVEYQHSKGGYDTINLYTGITLHKYFSAKIQNKYEIMRQISKKKLSLQKKGDEVLYHYNKFQ